MPDLPTVTIVTPSFNQAEFLEEAILSVLNQDYPKIEYLIIDGGSTDGSVEIIRKYEDRRPGLLGERAALGAVVCGQKGFQHANGEILGWLNSNDVSRNRA